MEFFVGGFLWLSVFHSKSRRGACEVQRSAVCKPRTSQTSNSTGKLHRAPSPSFHPDKRNKVPCKKGESDF